MLKKFVKMNIFYIYISWLLLNLIATIKFEFNYSTVIHETR